MRRRLAQDNCANAGRPVFPDEQSQELDKMSKDDLPTDAPGGSARMNSTASSDAVLQLFQETGAYLRGHFRLTSGLHSPEYLQCALVLQHPASAERLGQLLARECERIEPEEKITVVVAPAMGGLIIGHEVARALRARSIFTERDPASKRMILRRGFTLEPSDKALVIEDVVTTGGSSREVVELLRDLGVKVVGAGSIIDRSGGRADLTVPRRALVTLQVMAYNPESCPLCLQGVPLRKPGSRPDA